MHIFRVLVAVGLLALAAPQTGQAQSAAPIGLVAAGDYAAARSAVEGAPLVDRELIEALIDLREGNTQGAIDRYRTILRIRPDHALARRLLANALAKDNQYEAAEYQFNRLLETDPNPENRASYNRALRALFARKPFGVSASAAIVPSTNINRGTANEVFSTDFGDFVIDEDNLGTTGIGLALNAGAFHRFELPGGARLQIDAKAGVIFYDKPQFNQHSYTLRAALTDRTSNSSWSIAPELSRTYLAGDPYYDRMALAVGRGWVLSPERAFILKGLAEYRDYADEDALTGPRFEFAGTYRQQLNPRTRLDTTLSYKRGAPQSDAFSYDGLELGANLSRTFENGLQLGLGASHEWRPYRGDFTGVTFPREDNITSIDISVFSDRWTFGGAAPTYSCSVTWAASNIAFYDYTVQECSIGFTRNF